MGATAGAKRRLKQGRSQHQRKRSPRRSANQLRHACPRDPAPACRSHAAEQPVVTHTARCAGPGSRPAQTQTAALACSWCKPCPRSAAGARVA